MGTLVSIDNHLFFSPRLARVEVFDRGFLYGDSIYETVRTYGGHPFEWAEHLARLHRSAERTELRLPVGDGELWARLRRALRAAGNPESQARLVVTRGGGPLSMDPRLARRGRTVLIVRSLQPLPARLYDDGVAAALVALSAGEKGMDPAAKTGSHLGQVLAFGRASAQGAHEALMVDTQGNVTEGVSSNLFAMIGGKLVTPPLGTVLEGVTRGRTLRLARRAGMPVEERPLAAAELSHADEILLTSTLREILPVTQLEGRPVGEGKVGPAARALLAAFRREIAVWLAGRVTP
jgi:branched-chain amino acid aminotransferase